MDFKNKIAELLEKSISLKDFSSEKIALLLETPPSSELGDLSFPCFKLSSALKKKPDVIALDLKKELEKEKEKLIERIEVKGSYLNFFLDYSFVASELIPLILKEKEKYGSNSSGKGRKAMVEYSAPNTNKPLTLGHLRNDSIGMAVSNLYEANGCSVIRANLYSNRGIHICNSLLGYMKWGKGKKPDIKPDHFVGKFYVMFHQKAKEQPELEKEAFELLSKWEKKDKEIRELWKQMDEWVIKGFKETYKEFGSVFDVEFKESDFYDKAKPLIESGLKKGVFIKTDEGAIEASLGKYGLNKKAILRADGTSIYITNDLALTKHKFEKFKPDKALWVVGSEQNFYFKQLFKILELLGFEWARKCVHLSYGMVYLPEGVMKSREGIVVDADAIINEMKELAKKEILKRHKDLNEKKLQERAKAIGLGAIKFYLLKIDPVKDIYFDPEKSISLEGETASFIQYAFARCSSILKKAKAKIDSKNIDFSLLDSVQEKNLLTLLSRYPSVIASSLNSLNPSILCHYLLELASSFNAFYRDCKVLEAEEEKRKARISLVEGTSIVLKNGLSVIGINAVEEM
ncbi:MAG: arginine--tRNA ligase [archaeon]